MPLQTLDNFRHAWIITPISYIISLLRGVSYRCGPPIGLHTLDPPHSSIMMWCTMCDIGAFNHLAKPWKKNEEHLTHMYVLGLRLAIFIWFIFVCGYELIPLTTSMVNSFDVGNAMIWRKYFNMVIIWWGNLKNYHASIDVASI